MANRRDYFFKQKVQEDELDAGFQGLEDADRAVITDSGFFGITFGLGVSQNSPTPNLNVRVAGPGAGFDQTGQRISIPSNQLVNVAVDSTSSPTAVASPGNEKIVSVNIRFKRALSDPRIDGNSVTVYFVQDESFEFIVAQGPEGPHPATPPAKLGDGLLLADITRTFGQTAIHNADISITRRDDQIVIESLNIPEIRAGTLPAAFSQLVSALDAFVSGSASLIAYGGGPAWADGTTNPPSNIQTEIDHIISVLATGAGTAKIEGSAHADSPDSLSSQRLDQQLIALLSFVNDRLRLEGGTLTGDLTMGTGTNLFPTTNNQALGGSSSPHRWKPFVQDIDLAGSFLYSSARTFHKFLPPDRSPLGFFGNLSPSDPNYDLDDPSFVQVNRVASAPTDWVSTQQIVLPQGAIITAATLHWRTGNVWTQAFDGVRAAIWRQPRFGGAAHSKEYYRTGFGAGPPSVGIPGYDVFGAPDGTNNTDQNSAMTISNPGVSDQTIDNSAYLYFFQFDFSSFGSNGTENARVYGLDIAYTMTRGDEY